MESQNPPARWIDLWLGINFYSNKCTQHKNKYETVFCCTCMKEKAVCETCWKNKSIDSHKDHDYLQVRRASGRTAVDVGDITKHFCVSEIQTYSINSKAVVYLNPNEESPDKSKKCPYKCELCKGRVIVPKFKFCSIACKKQAVGLKNNEDVSNESAIISTVDRKRQVEEEEETNTTIMMAPSSSLSPPPPNEEGSSSSERPPKRRRKGIPVRSPLK